MADEELEELCSKIIDKMMKDDRFFLHMIIQGFGRRVERLAEAHEENKEVCHNCGFFKDHCVCKKPQTNDDRINTMSAEEKADFFVKFTTICEMCIHHDENCMTMSDERCKEGILQWLKSEVKE